MPWIVYETKNLITGSIYIGVLKTTRANAERYLGSGAAIRAAIQKYGKENFKRTTLIECDTAEEAYLLEAAVVDEEWIEKEGVYNLKTGGWGGRGHKMSEEARRKIAEYRRNATEANAKISRALTGRRLSDEHRRKLSEARRVVNKGRKLSEETKRLLAERQRAAWARGRKSHKGGDAT